MNDAPLKLPDQLKILDAKLKQLKLDYEHYFQGARPRPPKMSRTEIQKSFTRLSNTAIKNTADRFKFSSLNSRFMVFKRQWDEILRKIEAGTYERHVFKANLRERERGLATGEPNPAPKSSKSVATGSDDIFASYVDAARSCGQNVESLTPEKLQAAIRKQESAIKQKLGVDKVKFRVSVENGKVKLKATAVRAA